MSKGKNKMQFPYHFQWSSQYPHVAHADIRGNGVLEEIIVVAIDPKNGDLYYISTSALDPIDNKRMENILKKRDAANYQMWDLLDTTTLRNGVNALEYFNQLTMVRSVSGQIFKPGVGKIGASFALGKKLTSEIVANSPSEAPQSEAPFFENHTTETSKTVKRKS